MSGWKEEYEISYSFAHGFMIDGLYGAGFGFFSQCYFRVQVVFFAFFILGVGLLVIAFLFPLYSGLCFLVYFSLASIFSGPCVQLFIL